MTRRDNHILILIDAQSSSCLSRYRWWPDNIPRPQAAQGTLRGAKLANVRVAIAETISTWEDGHSRKGGCQLPAPTGRVYRHTITWPGHRLSSGTCWTPAEYRLRRIIDQYFDNKMP
ncbi:hypothetical protein [Novosphingobium lindaniclasticum]|uniref:hypothetical protein n=1 Tax=Novosphingobium lindaniclasticum TaxID=1329895 RepID=UPI001267B6C2|nr:hypothetical protein [Novosphingobium lindaniclasticum]